MKGRFGFNWGSPRLLHKLTLGLLLFELCTGCLSLIDFPTEHSGGTLAVSGQISTLPGRSLVQVGVTSTDERLPHPISGALVRLMEGKELADIFLERNPGIYFLSDFTGQSGKTYHLEIILPDGKIYESIPEKLPMASSSLTSSYEFVKEEFTDGEGTVSSQPFIKIYVNAKLTDSASYLKWTIEEVYLLSPTDFPDPFGYIPPPCFIQQNADPQRVSLFDGSVSSTLQIERQFVASRIVDYSFLEKHAFTIYQSTLTNEAHDYWRKVNILANQMGSIFDTPPAEIAGNIFNQANPLEKTVGNFQAVNETFSRFFIYPDNIPFRVLALSCSYGGNINVSERCSNCLSVRNSSLQAPDWF